MHINQQVKVAAKGDFKGMDGRIVGFVGEKAIVEIVQRGGECVHFDESDLAVMNASVFAGGGQKGSS